jgi:hypothetical protein
MRCRRGPWHLWQESEPFVEPRVAWPLFGAELLMAAGVRELVKDEFGQAWVPRDDVTLSLLTVALVHLQAD